MSTAVGLTPKQLAVHNAGIGSSSAPAACGMSPFKSRVQLWLEDTGRVERPDLSDRKVIRRGTYGEAWVAQEYAHEHGCKVRRRNDAYIHPEHDFMLAHVDRLIEGTGRILECKTATMWKTWDDVPEHYRIQVQHQLICSRKREAVLAVLFGDWDYQDWEIEYNPRLAQAIVAKEVEYWSFVQTDSPPPATTAQDVVDLYPVDSGKVVVATAELAEIHAELMSVRGKYKDVEAEKEALTEKVKLFIGPDAEVVLGQGGEKLATWKTSAGSKFCNWEAIATELMGHYRVAFDGDDPELEINRIIAAHSGTTKHGSRRFLPKELK